MFSAPLLVRSHRLRAAAEASPAPAPLSPLAAMAAGGVVTGTGARPCPLGSPHLPFAPCLPRCSQESVMCGRVCEKRTGKDVRSNAPSAVWSQLWPPRRTRVGCGVVRPFGLTITVHVSLDPCHFVIEDRAVKTGRSWYISHCSNWTVHSRTRVQYTVPGAAKRVYMHFRMKKIITYFLGGMSMCDLIKPYGKTKKGWSQWDFFLKFL